MTDLRTEIEKTNHSKEQRDDFAKLLISQPELLPQLLDFCALIDDEISFRAAWGLEFLCKKNLNPILTHLDKFLEIAPCVYKDQAVRPMAKICEYLTLSYYKIQSPLTKKAVTLAHRNKITELCFDWLITKQKVAPQAYSMTSLYWLGTEFDWIHSELKTTLETNYHSGSAAYKARSRMILKKLS